jgi:hypothetical protein
MRKNDHRKLAEDTYLTDRGRITNKELAQQLGVHPATVARWKKLDDWDYKLVKVMSEPEPAVPILPDEDLFSADFRHIGLLNERIDSYLQKKELLPSEILELAEAKYHIINCVTMINDQLRYPFADGFDDHEDDLD